MGFEMRDPLLLLRESSTLSQTDRLYEKMKYMIISGTLSAGYSFPNENDMCAQLSVGRGTLREVYRTLMADGLISRSKAGTFVNDRSTIMRTAPFGIAAELSCFQDVYEFRLMLECENARYAAQRATEEEIGALAGLLNESHRCKGNVAQLQELDLAFHKAIADYSHNVLLINVTTDVWASFETILTRNYRRLNSSSTKTIGDAIEHHTAVYDAIAARNGQLAGEAMQWHIRAVFGEINS